MSLYRRALPILTLLSSVVTPDHPPAAWTWLWRAPAAALLAVAFIIILAVDVAQATWWRLRKHWR